MRGVAGRAVENDLHPCLSLDKPVVGYPATGPAVLGIELDYADRTMMSGCSLGANETNEWGSIAGKPGTSAVPVGVEVWDLRFPVLFIVIVLLS